MLFYYLSTCLLHCFSRRNLFKVIELILFIVLLMVILLPLSYLLGKFISINFSESNEPQKSRLQNIFECIEKPIYKICGINPKSEKSAKEYFFSLFWSNMVLSAICFFGLYYQNRLPFNGLVNHQLDLPIIFHILSSLITNTCQTHHIPELHLTPFSNIFILSVLMFYSSASGIATGIMAMRAIILGKIGNPYTDVIKAMTRILFPICFIVTIIFTALGMPNTFNTHISYETIENIKETLILGPVAGFEAIKLIGENGQSCFNANSAHPFENPSYLTNFIQIICILIVPTALIITLGFWLKNHRQSWIILSVLFSALIFEFITVGVLELNGNHGLNSIINSKQPNWVGKETRLGIVGSSVFEAAISNVSGSSNSALESFHPVTIALSLFNLSNQSFFGVQGFGLVFTINFILYTVFLIGLILGKTPEIFGKRIGKNEILLSSALLLINPILVLLSVVFTLNFHPIRSTSFYEHVHYFTQVFYEFASGAASNGSGLESLNDNTPYWNISLAIVMFLARYLAMGSMIMLGGSLAKKPAIPTTQATFKTDTVLFGFTFLFMSVITTTLTYFPFIVLSTLTEILMHG